MPSISQLLLVCVVPGFIAATAGAIWRWPLRANPTAGRLMSGVALVGGFAFSCWALDKLEWHTDRYGQHWAPYAVGVAVLISLLDIAIPGRIGKALQAVAFLAFLPAAAWFLAPDYPVHRELRWPIIGGLAVSIGFAWCASDFVARKHSGRFPILLASILISTLAAGIIAHNSLPTAMMAGGMTAVLTGIAMFAGRDQESIASPAAAFFAVGLVGLLYSSYAGGISSFKGNEIERDVAFGLAVLSAWLLPLYVWVTPKGKELSWRRGAVLTGLIILPALAGLILLGISQAGEG